MTWRLGIFCPAKSNLLASSNETKSRVSFALRSMNQISCGNCTLGSAALSNRFRDTPSFNVRHFEQSQRSKRKLMSSRSLPVVVVLTANAKNGSDVAIKIADRQRWSWQRSSVCVLKTFSFDRHSLVSLPPKTMLPVTAALVPACQR